MTRYISDNKKNIGTYIPLVGATIRRAPTYKAKRELFSHGYYTGPLPYPSRIWHVVYPIRRIRARRAGQLELFR